MNSRTGNISRASTRNTSEKRFPGPNISAENACASSEETYDLTLLEPSLKKWRKSEALRVAYGSLYRQMQAAALPGPALELGSGIGVIREFIPDVVTSDVAPTPFAERIVSAYALAETAPGPWATIYMLDVLHHLRRPFRFFESAAAVLEIGGRVVMMEPAATIGGRMFYRAFHHEPIKPEEVIEPYDFGADEAGAEFANMAMGWSLFERDRSAVARRLRELGLEIHAVVYRDLLAYPATGGFSKPSFLPVDAIESLLAWEASLPEGVMRKLGQRMLIVVERIE